MMPNKSTLFITRMIVTRGARRAYDEKFHAGVNIIRGENGSGKSTIADLMFFALGGDLQRWVPEALLCDDVYIEAEICDVRFTLRRPIEEARNRPMFIKQVSIEDALASSEGWSKYPFSAVGELRSFSEMFFEFLGFPQSRSELGDAVTMHQVLRLIYSDQETPFTKLFRTDQWDKPATREAVADLLLGIGDFRIFNLRREKRALEKTYDELAGELRSLYALLGIYETNFEPSIIKDQLNDLILQKEKTQSLLEQAQSDAASSADDVPNKTEVDRLVAEIRRVGNELADRVEKYTAMLTDAEDTEAFVLSLSTRIASIRESASFLDVIGSVDFILCPACLSPLNDSGEGEEARCVLCKEAVDEESGGSGRLRLLQEMEFQLRESEKILERKQAEAAELRDEIAELRRSLDVNKRKYRSFEVVPRGESARAVQFAEELGYLSRKIEETHERYSASEVLQKKLDEKNRLKGLLDDLEAQIESAQLAQLKRREKVGSDLSTYVVEMLRNDIKSEEHFENAETFEVDFGKELMIVDGRSKFSASSQVILKNSVHFSMFRMSLTDSLVRWPRFILMDNIEDKGMTPLRSANFQKLMVEISENASVDHQIIFTTSMIAKDLEDSVYCVGPHYYPVPGKKSLAIG